MRGKCLLLISFMFILFACTTACAQALPLTIEENKTQSGTSFVDIPRVSGHPDPLVEERINAAIYEDGGFADYERILASLDPQATGLEVWAESQLIEAKNGQGLLSIKITAAGRIGPGRPGWRVTPLMYDMQTGERVRAEHIFSDTDLAQTLLNELVEREIEPLISDYLQPDGLYPVPIEQLLVDDSGMTFFYAQEAYTTLSSQSGAVNFHWDELEDIVDIQENSTLSSLVLISQAENASLNIQAAVEEGRLPGIPVTLKDDLEAVLATYPLLMDSEAFPDGEKYQLEDARFRGCILLGKENKIIGLLSHRANLYGLITGRASQDEAEVVLGQPQARIELDEATAESYGLTKGSIDSYMYGNNQLRLHYDSGLVLQTVWLSPAN